MKKNNIALTLNNLAQDIDELEDQKNLNTIVKQYETITQDLISANNIVIDLKNKLNKNADTITVCNTDAKYEKLMDEIFAINENYRNIINNDDIEAQIEKYIELDSKISACKQYLENKQLTFIAATDENIASLKGGNHNKMSGNNSDDDNVSAKSKPVNNNTTNTDTKSTVKKVLPKKPKPDTDDSSDSSSSSSSSSASSTSDDADIKKRPTANKKIAPKPPVKRQSTTSSDSSAPPIAKKTIAKKK